MGSEFERMKEDAQGLEGDAEKAKQEEGQHSNELNQLEGDADKTKTEAEDLEKKI